MKVFYTEKKVAQVMKNVFIFSNILIHLLKSIKNPYLFLFKMTKKPNKNNKIFVRLFQEHFEIRFYIKETKCIYFANKAIYHGVCFDIVKFSKTFNTDICPKKNIFHPY